MDNRFCHLGCNKNPQSPQLPLPMAVHQSISESLQKILTDAVDTGASDVHLAPGENIYLRVEGVLVKRDQQLTSQQTKGFAQSVLSAAQIGQLDSRGSVDGAISLDDESRFRFNIYLRDDSICFALRLLPKTIATLGELGLGDQLYQLCDLKDGLILVAGPTGSGKSTTIAALIDRINQRRSSHIVTIEDPIEFVHRSTKSLVNQRQVGTDVPSFQQALLDAVRQDPDVILVGELRDLETIRTAITAAETGHLVFASVHAGDAKTAIERLISAYSAEEQNFAQRLVATVLRSVIVQHLLPRYESLNQPLETEAKLGRVLASEVMHVNSAIANLIANGTLSQIASMIETNQDDGMWTLDGSLARLWRSRKISEQTARSLARNPAMLNQLSKRISRA